MRLLAIGLTLLVACKTDKAAPPPAPAPAPAKVPAPDRSAALNQPRVPARPPQPPALPPTAMSWSAAEAANTALGWDAAAENYERELGACKTSCAETAYTIVLARQNALAAAPEDRPPPGTDPVPVPERTRALIDALDNYAAVADPSDPDVAGAKFVAANYLNHYRQPDALDRLRDVLTNYRGAEVSEYAANILIDQLLNAGRIDEVRALVDELLADTAYLAAKPDLRATLDKLHALLAAN